jgi:sec-independent protein translocase protein TatB
MFGVNFSELMVILVIALIVIGPERLPKVARTLGLLWARAQRYINGIKADIARDMAVEEFRLLQQKVQQEVMGAEQALKQTAQSLEQRAQQISDAVATPARSIAQAAQLAVQPTVQPPPAPETSSTPEAPPQQSQLDLQLPEEQSEINGHHEYNR